MIVTRIGNIASMKDHNDRLLRYKKSIECPFCTNDNVEPEGEEGGDGLVFWVKMCCNICKSTWVEIYRYETISDLKPGLFSEI